MQGKILIVDSISTNRIVLKVKLSSAFYHVLQAGTLAEALTIIDIEKPDLVVSAMKLPDGSVADLCHHLRGARHATAIPVLAIGCGIDENARLETLYAGVTEVMHRPLNETLLLGRVRNMIRMHNQLAEWQIRDDTNCALGLSEAPAEFTHPGRITLIGLDTTPFQGWVRQLSPHLSAEYKIAHLRDSMSGMQAENAPDVIVLSLPSAPELTDECLRLIPALRASARTRDIALLVIQKTIDPLRLTSALDMGADDVMTAGFRPAELALRIQVLLRRKRQVAKILQNVRTGLREVVNDPLTGLYNRRYAMPYMARMIEQCSATSAPFAVILGDMDYFKRINDVYGHASGDAVLVETARRLRSVARHSDVVSRIGGEEFMIAMPATDVALARKIADRICSAIADVPFVIPGSAQPVSITISLGLTLGRPPLTKDDRSIESVETLLDRADKALYVAKMQGRNRVTLSQPHARPAA
jgi:two-component system cell cycle response regulator